MNHRHAVYLAVLPCALFVACGTSYGGEPEASSVPEAPKTEPDASPPADVDAHTAEADAVDAGNEAGTCSSWGSTAPPADDGITLGELEIVELHETSDAEYRLELQSAKGAAGPSFHRLLLERRCKTTACVCPGVMHVSNLGSNPTVKMAIAQDKAAISIEDPLFNGGKRLFTLCIDLTGQTAATSLPYGSPVSECP